MELVEALLNRTQVLPSIAVLTGRCLTGDKDIEGWFPTSDSIQVTNPPITIKLPPEVKIMVGDTAALKIDYDTDLDLQAFSEDKKFLQATLEVMKIVGCLRELSAESIPGPHIVGLWWRALPVAITEQMFPDASPDFLNKLKTWNALCTSS